MLQKKKYFLRHFYLFLILMCWHYVYLPFFSLHSFHLIKSRVFNSSLNPQSKCDEEEISIQVKLHFFPIKWVYLEMILWEICKLSSQFWFSINFHCLHLKSTFIWKKSADLALKKLFFFHLIFIHSFPLRLLNCFLFYCTCQLISSRSQCVLKSFKCVLCIHSWECAV